MGDDSARNCLDEPTLLSMIFIRAHWMQRSSWARIMDGWRAMEATEIYWDLCYGNASRRIWSWEISRKGVVWTTVTAWSSSSRMVRPEVDR